MKTYVIIFVAVYAVSAGYISNRRENKIYINLI